MAAPLDPRLMRLVPPVRGLILRTGSFQALDTVLVIARGVLIGTVAARAITSDARLRELWPLLLALLAVVLLHAAAAWASSRAQAHAVGKTVDALRRRSLRALATRDPRVVQEESGQWRHVLTRGMEDFRPYLSQFLPALVAVCIATPAALVTIAYFDWVSAVFALVTLPLIPAFMVLIGALTAQHTQRRLAVTAGLGGQLADLVRGAPTLRALHATKQPTRSVGSLGERHSKATMGVLRLAFLSSFALEFLATLSVALVAVNIGLRLVTGSIELLPALVVLIIVPEVFNPVRTVGSSFHAAADGLEAAQMLLGVIDSAAAKPEVTGGYRTLVGSEVSVSHVSISGRDGMRPQDLTFKARPGALTVLSGANGSGKSTVLLALLGALPDAAVTGTVRLPPGSAYLAASPALVTGTVAENLALTDATDSALAAAQDAVPLGVGHAHAVTTGGTGISAGQRERVGIVRTLAVDAPCYLLDEPTAHLSAELVANVITALQARAHAGAVVLVASHDPRLIAKADEVIEL